MVLNAENWCIRSNNTLQHKHGVSITLTCWFEAVNTNDFDHPLCSAICYFSCMDVESVAYDRNATLLRYSELITM